MLPFNWQLNQQTMTSTDLKEYLGIIERMKGLLNSREFEQTFNSLTASLPKSKQFLIKMELKRLAQPCNYFIDLRGHVDGDVKPYQHLDKTHYLDDTARQIFENGIRDYGLFSIGVYEEVMNADNNFRVRHRKETEERVKSTLENLRKGPQIPEQNAENDKNTPPEQAVSVCKLVQFGHYIKRTEERMNFGLEVEVRYAEQRFSAITSDISVSGLKLKMNTIPTINKGDTLNLALKGLEKEFTLDLPNGLDYRVVDIEDQEKFTYLRLKRVSPTEHPQFNQFLENYINGNKRRYKVNLDNSTDATLAKGYEQYYLPRINNLPIYLSITEGVLNSRFALTSDYNKSIWHYFLDERQQSVLNFVLAARRLKPLLTLSPAERSTILYCFTHATKGKLYFYVASAIELANDPELRSMFLGFGSGKPSWKVFHLHITKTNIQQSKNDSAIPASAEEQTISPLIQSMLLDMHYIVSLTDISAAEHRSNYTCHSYSPDRLPTLNKFGLSKAEQTRPCEAIPIHYVNLRSEPRYLYKTNVLVRQKAEQQAWLAFTRDFSMGGLQLEFSEPIDFVKGELLLLDLPDLQKISIKHQLSHLPYEVMAVSRSRTIMNLKIARSEAHVGKDFFKQLIQSNRNKLTVAEETAKYPGLSDALRNMYLKSLSNFAFFIHRHGLRHDINVLARGAHPNALHKLLQLAQTDKNILDFSLITKGHLLQQDIANQLKNMKRHDPAKPYELLIKVSKLASGKLVFSSRYDFEFTSSEALQHFVLETIKQHTLFSFRFFVSRTGKLDATYIAKEIGYISTYAIHKAKLLEEELWHVEGVADGVETSAELISRFNLEASEQQQQARLKILARER